MEPPSTEVISDRGSFQRPFDVDTKRYEPDVKGDCTKMRFIPKLISLHVIPLLGERNTPLSVVVKMFDPLDTNPKTDLPINDESTRVQAEPF